MQTFLWPKKRNKQKLEKTHLILLSSLAAIVTFLPPSVYRELRGRTVLSSINLREKIKFWCGGAAVVAGSGINDLGCFEMEWLTSDGMSSIFFFSSFFSLFMPLTSCAGRAPAVITSLAALNWSCAPRKQIAAPSSRIVLWSAAGCRSPRGGDENLQLRFSVKTH